MGRDTRTLSRFQVLSATVSVRPVRELFGELPLSRHAAVQEEVWPGPRMLRVFPCFPCCQPAQPPGTPWRFHNVPCRSPPDAGARRGGGPGHDSSVGQTWRRPIRGEGGPGRRWRGAGLFRHLISDAMPGAARERQSFPDDGVVENALNCQKSVSMYDDRQTKSS